MRSPRWMVAYAVGLAMVAGIYASLVHFGSGAALVFGILALVAIGISLALVILR